MLEWIKSLLPCKHQWEIIDKRIVDFWECNTSRRPYKCEFHYVLRCTKCGDIKFKKHEIE